GIAFKAAGDDGKLPMDEQSVLARTACPQRDQAVIADGSDSARGAAPPEEEFLLGMTLDLTEWDGISFWARRSSNDAQGGFRVVLGDKHTDDDLSYHPERHCLNARSEEHTSELQSRENLVCRLLLEKK